MAPAEACGRAHHGVEQVTRQRSSGRGMRELKVRVKTAKGRPTGSTRWLERQLNDPYVKRARSEGWRGRAAFKLIEIDDRFDILKPGHRVLDLGCSPGGWCQVAVRRVNALHESRSAPVGRVVGIDLRATAGIAGAELHVLDFLEAGAPETASAILGGSVEVVLSDMAAPTVGHKKTDHLRTVALAEAAASFAFGVLTEGGAFVAKVLAGGAEAGLQRELKIRFHTVRNVKPPASRIDSSERYVVAMGYRV